MSNRTPRHVIETLLSIPWALSEDYARRMLAVAGRQGDPAALAAERGEPLPNTREVTVREGVATIPVMGPMFRYADLFSEVSGATSYETLARDLTTALADPQVRAILLDVDSPGGEVFGAGELSDLLYNARGSKPIIAHVGGFCASAALWIASAADEIVVSSVGLVGSVGAAMSITVPDAERQAELFGEREVEFVSSQSPNKNVDPTSKAGREQYQAIVDRIAGVFGADLARNLGVSESTVWERFGRGSLLVGSDAVQAGMAARVATYEATHRGLVRRLESGGLRFRAAERPAETATVLETLFGRLNLEKAIRPAAALRAAAAGLGSGRLHLSTGGTAADSPPAPKADHQEDRTMSDQKTAAPAPGAAERNELAEYRARVAAIKNLCAVAGHPELVAGFIDNDELTLDQIRDQLLAKQKEERGTPEPVGVPVAKADSIRVGADRAAQKPFAHLGEQLMAVARHSMTDGRQSDPRLNLVAAAQGLSEAVPADGGFLVQKDFVQPVRERMYQTGQILQRVERNPIGPNSNGIKLNYIDETSRADGSRHGGIQGFWANEADTFTKSKPKFRQIDMSLEKLIGLVYATDELLQDAVALGAWINRNLPAELTFKAEDAVVNGTGAGQPLGLLSSGAVVEQAIEGTQTIANTADFLAINFAKMYSRMYAPLIPQSVWLVTQEILAKAIVMTIGGSGGATPVYLPGGNIAGAPFGTILGRPVVPVEYTAKEGTPGDIIFAALSEYLLIDKGGIQSDVSIHVQFLTGEQVFRFTYRVNGQPTWNAPLTPKNAGPTQAPFITLGTRS